MRAARVYWVWIGDSLCDPYLGYIHTSLILPSCKYMQGLMCACLLTADDMDCGRFHILCRLVVIALKLNCIHISGSYSWACLLQLVCAVLIAWLKLVSMRYPCTCLLQLVRAVLTAWVNDVSMCIRVYVCCCLCVLVSAWLSIFTNGFRNSMCSAYHWYCVCKHVHYAPLK